MHIHPVAAGRHTIDLVGSIRIGQRADSRTIREQSDHRGEMHPLAAHSDRTRDGSESGRKGAFRIEHRDGGQIIGIQGLGARRGTRNRCRHGRRCKRMLQPERMAHLVDHRSKETFHVTRSGRYGQINIQVNNGFKNRHERPVRTFDRTERGRGTGKGQQPRRHLFEYDFATRSALLSAGSLQAAEGYPQAGSRHRVPDLRGVANLRKHRRKTVVDGVGGWSAVGNKESDGLLRQRGQIELFEDRRVGSR